MRPPDCIRDASPSFLEYLAVLMLSPVPQHVSLLENSVSIQPRAGQSTPAGLVADRGRIVPRRRRHFKKLLRKEGCN